MLSQTELLNDRLDMVPLWQASASEATLLQCFIYNFTLLYYILITINSRIFLFSKCVVHFFLLI